METNNYNMAIPLPHDEQTEKNILGTIYHNDAYFSMIDDIVDSTMFYTQRFGDFFRIMKYIIREKKVINESEIKNTYGKFKGKLSINEDELDTVLRRVSLTKGEFTFEQDVKRLVDYSVRRKAWEVFQNASVNVTTLAENADDVITSAFEVLEKIRNITPENDIVDAQKACSMLQQQIADNIAGIRSASVYTGFRFTDAKGGLRLGSVLVIGAWTSVGKTALALNMTYNMASAGIPVAYYSLEMGAVELWSRIMAANTNISAGKILNYPLKRVESEKIDTELQRVSKIPLFIDDKATTNFNKMLRSVRTMVKQYKIKVFAVDYLQNFAQNSKNNNDESNLSFMARQLKNICLELNIACILLSQLRRDKDDRHPSIDKLRGSGQIEESADNVVLIDRPDAHPEWGVTSFRNDNTPTKDHAQLIVAKGRNIGLGNYIVGYDSQRVTFYEIDGYRLGDEIGYDDIKPVF